MIPERGAIFLWCLARSPGTVLLLMAVVACGEQPEDRETANSAAIAHSAKG